MFNLFNVSLCNNNVNIYNINISQCEYSIIEDYQPNSLEINSGEINYNWIVPELIDTYQDYKILISSMNNSIMMISSLFTIENNPSTTPTTTLTTTPTTTLTTTPTTTLTSSTMTTTNIYPAEPDTHFPIYIPILSALGSILFIYLLCYCVKLCIREQKHKSNRIRPTGREFYNNNYESNTNRYNDEHVIYNESPNYADINNRILNNNMYHETSFGGYGSYYNRLSPSGKHLPDRDGNTYNQLDREQYHNRYNHINRNSQNVQDKIRKTMRKDEPNMDLIRAINQEIHSTTQNCSINIDMDSRNLNNPTYI
jgi:hypothetical protein